MKGFSPLVFSIFYWHVLVLQDLERIDEYTVTD